MLRKMNLRNNVNEQMFKSKHIPQRGCVACKTTQDKEKLIRLVCNSHVVEVDTLKKRVGRGAYLCPKYECWEAALKGNRLNYALRTSISEENRHNLMQYAQTFIKREEV